MQYELIIGNKNYSSWSMRAWLLMKLSGLKFRENTIDLFTPGSREKVRALGGQTGLVPALKVDDLVIWDTLAIAEYLYESQSIIWPSDKNERAIARSICCEIHSGIMALRTTLPVNIRARKTLDEITDSVKEDINRIEQIVETRLMLSKTSWLFGQYGFVDIMFAPVATRFQTYGVRTTSLVEKYFERLLALPDIQRWCEMSELESQRIEQFEDV